MQRGGIVILYLIITAISLGLDWYVFSGLKTLTESWQSILLRQLVNWGYLFFSVGLLILFLTGLSSFRTARGMTPFHEWVFSLFLWVLVTKLIFIAVLLFGDVCRLFYGIVNNLIRPSGKLEVPFFPARRQFVSQVAVFAASTTFVGFLYAMIKGKYDYKVHRQTLYYKDLPLAFDGFTITQLSDIHSGSFDDVEAMQRGIDLAKAQKSDLFVFTGDLVNNAAWEIEPYLERFGQIKAPFGQFSILGNHDYGDYIQWDNDVEKAANLQTLKKHHAEMGYRLLLNENVNLEKNGEKIALIGVENWGQGFKQKGDLDKALIGVDQNAFKILLSHDPTHWEEKVKQHPANIHLTLSGHTHGAQFGIEIPGFKWSPVQYRYPHWAGVANEKNRYLYINRGFGFLGFSGRLGIWPEVTVITLKKMV